MSTITAKGIVIRETYSGEADKFITVLLKDYGTMSIFCKGARNTKSKFLASTSLFCFSEFVIYTGAKTKTLASAHLIESFYDLRLDYDRLIIGTYFLEMSDKLILPSVNVDDFIRLLFVALKKLSNEKNDARLIKAVFEFKFLELSGLFPASHFCGNCNKAYVDFVEKNKVFFDYNGILCYDCKQHSIKSTILVDYSTIYVINYILETKIESVFNFSISDKTLINLEKCANLFIIGNIDEKFKSLNSMGRKL